MEFVIFGIHLRLLCLLFCVHLCLNVRSSFHSFSYTLAEGTLCSLWMQHCGLGDVVRGVKLFKLSDSEKRPLDVRDSNVLHK